MEEKFCFPCDEPIVEKDAPCPSQCKSPKCGAYKRRPKADLDGKIFVWVIGGPFSGKKTLCQKLSSKYGLTYIVPRELCKAEIKANTIRSKCLISIMERKELVPNETIIYLLKREIEARAHSAKGFIIYDFPREERQGKAFDEQIRPVSIIFHLNASDALMKDRALKGHHHPTDKELEVLKIRFKNFHDQNRHIVEQYPHRIVELKAEKSPDEIFNAVSVHMTEVMKKQTQEAERKAQEEATKPMLGMNTVKK